MAPIRNARAYFAATPTEHIEPGVHVKYDDSATVDLDSIELSGGFLIKTLCLGIDPFMRTVMHSSTMVDPKIQAYIPVYEFNRPLIGYGVGRIVRSEDEAYKFGDVLHGWLYHEEYSVYHGPLTAVIPFCKIEDIGLPWSVYVSVLGMPGQTAFWGWTAYNQAKAGETIFISSAAGTVGSLVIQLAKRGGLRVIASSGSDEKAAYATECGADFSFDYKKEKVWDVLAREQQGVDIYVDNVGGEHLDAALLHSNKSARFIVYGMASLYNSEPYNVQNLGLIIGKAISLHGVLHHTFYPQHADEFYHTVPQLVKEGAFKHHEDISLGLETVGQALYDVGSGKTFGKRVVVVANA